MEPFEDWHRREHPRIMVTLLLVTGDIELASEGVDEACALALALSRWGRVPAMEELTGWANSVALKRPAASAAAGASSGSWYAARPRSRTCHPKPARPGASWRASPEVVTSPGQPPAQPSENAPMSVWQRGSEETHLYLEEQVAHGLMKVNPGCVVTTSRIPAPQSALRSCHSW